MIKTVAKHSGKKRDCGKLYLNKGYIGRKVFVFDALDILAYVIGLMIGLNFVWMMRLIL